MSANKTLGNLTLDQAIELWQNHSDESERLAKAYDALKGQLMHATGYTDWTGDGED